MFIVRNFTFARVKSQFIISDLMRMGIKSRSMKPNGGNCRLYYPYWQYTDPFIFRFGNNIDGGCFFTCLKLVCCTWAPFNALDYHKEQPKNKLCSKGRPKLWNRERYFSYFGLSLRAGSPRAEMRARNNHGGISINASELYKDWNDTWKPNFEAFVEADMQVIPSPP